MAAMHDGRSAAGAASPSDDLGAAIDLPAEELAARAARALARAAGGDHGAAEDLDRAVAGAILAHPDPDGVLAGIAPDDLAALVDRWSDRLDATTEPDEAVRSGAWDALDLIRRRPVLRAVAAAGREEVERWAGRILRAIEVSHLTVGPLFRQRAENYGSKTLFHLPASHGSRAMSWRQASARIEGIARGLFALDPEGPGPVALLSENRPEMALVDLACLGSGLFVVMIPGNSTEADVGYILRHGNVRTVLASGAAQLRKVTAVRDGCPALRHVVAFDAAPDLPKGVATLDRVVAGGTSVAPEEIRRAGLRVRVGDPATVMYTSGTTGTPKGILFSHRNIVFKRFCRALAIPEIGEDDVFLCYLPLFHTFGRWLEMLGAVFWGATYCFLDNPSLEALVAGMRRHRPTVFISVPKKWIQLYEASEQIADPLEASDEAIADAVREVTGGRLRWGLSAAGHLNSEVFRFFQRQGVELMSGFGMTEATGGITMTPPGEYDDDSLGVALPGIEIRLADDGELLIRGPYVMEGYLDPPDGQSPFDGDGWFATGDLMEMSRNGAIRLVDRKKEIYKNIKGETIAPQRVENLFRDFDSVQRVFLVGDHREYNTLLVHPDYACTTPNLAAMSEDEVEAHFRSLVVGVNQFLAPYERIVDFAVIDRDLDPERGELTPKGTPRRRTVERNFEDVVRQLYRRSHVHPGGIDLIVPNWLFQALGLTARDLQVTRDAIRLPGGVAPLEVERLAEDRARIGSCVYRHRPGSLNIGSLLTSPPLWLGNAALVEWVGLDLAPRRRLGRNPEEFEWVGHVDGFEPAPGCRTTVKSAAQREDWTLDDVHRAACVLASSDAAAAVGAIRLLERVVAREEGPLAEAARLVLARAAAAPSRKVRRQAFHVLVQHERDARFAATLRRFLDRPDVLLDEDTRRDVAEISLSDAKVAAFVDATRTLCADPAPDAERIAEVSSLLRFVARYGINHPSTVPGLRGFLTRMGRFAPVEAVRAEAREARDELVRGFRRWLGPNSRIAVDPETGREYRWDDVLAFEDAVPEDDRRRIASAISTTAMLREAIFLFNGGASVRLSDVPPRGVWIRPLGSAHGKNVHRVTVQTRFQGAYDMAVNVGQGLAREQALDECEWLIVCSGDGDRPPLVEALGGYWDQQDLWTEEFIPGETLERAVRRLARRSDAGERLPQIWPFFAWTALAAFVDFWDRTGRALEIGEPGPANVVAPGEDYQTGARLVSVSQRVPHLGVASMMRRLRGYFVDLVETEHPSIAGTVDWSLLFHALLEVTGEAAGLALLREAIPAAIGPDGLDRAMADYVERVEVRGFVPLRAHFAIERYLRWASLTPDATPQARARTVQELYDTYGLARLHGGYPEIRVRFFRDTVFSDAQDALAAGLDDLIAALRRRTTSADEIIDAVADLRSRLTLASDEDYFLARLSFPHLRPEDAAAFVDHDFGGRHHSEMMVVLEDRDGNPFRVRHALNPREVGRLHRLFLASNLDVRFRMEHQYLVAINDRSQVIGGVYYEIEEAGQNAHLEKIAVAEPYRRKGVADALMHELFARLRAAGVRTVTTGFFRPEYFYGYGFTIEKRYAGLVKALDAAESPGRTTG